MRLIGLLVACMTVIGVGIAIGTVPIIKDNLHWNLWFVIPISGVILGAAFGWVQFQISRFFGAYVGGLTAAVLALACCAGYLATDLGQYATLMVELEAEEDFAGGAIPLSELMTFEEFMRARLESSAIDLRPGSSQEATLDIGSTGATVSFFADLGGAWLGAFGALILGAEGSPYCRRCRRYKKRMASNEIPLDQETAVETLDQLQEGVEAGRYQDVVSLLNEAAKGRRPSEPVVKIETDERSCPICNEATLICRIMTLQGADWEESTVLQVSSSAAESARLAPMA